MINSITSYINTHSLIPNNATIIVGLSGGPDSVFLLNFLHSIAKDRNLTLIAAHLNHEWREDAAVDTAFCKRLCEALQIEFVSKKASDITLDKKVGGSKEELGRLLRRTFFEQLLKEHNADLIALGQHEQDQQETFFIRLIRGTTLSGLIGMRPKAGVYIRPLLSTNKKDILNYLDTHNIAYLTDPTNVSESFLRNRIRLNVIPELKRCDERFDANFARTHEALVQAEDFLEKVTTTTFNEISSSAKNHIKLDVAKLQKLDPYLQNRILIHWLVNAGVPFTPSASLLAEIQRFISNTKSSRHQLYGAWTIVKDKNTIHINN